MECSCGKEKTSWEVRWWDCHCRLMYQATSQADGIVLDPLNPDVKASFTKHCKAHPDVFYSSDLSCYLCDQEAVGYDPHSLVPGDTSELLKFFGADGYDPTTLKVLTEQETTSARHNTGKINPIELDPQFIMGIAEVLSKSRTKYPEFNWALPTKLSTPYASLFRHLMAFQSGQDVDPEDGCHHMLKVAVNAMFIHYHNVNNKEESDDRFFKKNKK